MRRLMAAAACAVALVLAAGCGDDAGPADPGAASATSMAGAPSPDTGGDQQVCDQIKEVNTQYAGAVSAAFDKAFERAAVDDDAGADQALGELGTLTKEWASKIEPLVAGAKDPALKSALSDLLTKVQTLLARETSVNEMRAVLTGANTAFDKHCG